MMVEPDVCALRAQNTLHDRVAEWLPPFQHGQPDREVCSDKLDVYSFGYILLCVLLMSNCPHFDHPSLVQHTAGVLDQAENPMRCRVGDDMLGPLQAAVLDIHSQEAKHPRHAAAVRALAETCCRCMTRCTAERPSLCQAIHEVNRVIDELA